MNIEEAKQAKKSLEESIRLSIVDFMIQTGLRVDDVRVGITTIGNGSVDEVWTHVNVRVDAIM